MWQSPGNGIGYHRFQKFSVGWDVQNTGTATWEAANVQLTYLGGAKPHDSELVQLEASVAPGQEIVLSVHMIAPRNSTKYTTHWSLRQGDTFFCPLMLSFYVLE